MSLWALRANRTQNAAHDGTRGRTPHNFFEPRLAKGRGQSGINKHVGLNFFRLDGIALDKFGAVPPGKINRRFQQLHRYATSPVRSRDEKAGDRPDRFVIDWLQRSRGCQPRINYARREGAPANRLVADKRK